MTPTVISNPCPMLISCMDKQEAGYYCKSCQKVVVDFRDKSATEITAIFQPGQCGIFRREQLPQQSSLHFSRLLLFKLLMLCSFLGFSVSPLKAQQLPAPDKVPQKVLRKQQREQKADLKQKDREQVQTQNNRRKPLFKRRKKNRVLMGCPDF